MRSLIRLITFNSYFWLAVTIELALAIILARHGLTTLDLVVLLAYAAAAAALGLALRTPKRQIAQLDSLAAFDRQLREQGPTLAEFYSDNCGLCMAARPALDRLEQETSRQLRIVRLNVNEARGRELADRYGIAVTPTFLLFGSTGVKEEEQAFVLDRARVLYWLDQQTISP